MDEELKSVKSVKSVKTVKSKQTFDKVLERSRSLFKPQFVRDVATKREAIKRALSLQEASFTQSQFLSEYVNRVGCLLDSKSFVRRCQALGKDPYIVATHIAFEGVAKSRRAIEKGLDEFKNFFVEWNEPLFPLEQKGNSDGLLKYDQEHKLQDYQSLPPVNSSGCSSTENATV